MNIESSDLSEIWYLIRRDYQPAAAEAQGLLALAAGLTAFGEANRSLRLDYLRRNLVSKPEMLRLPLVHRGQTQFSTPPRR